MEPVLGEIRAALSIAFEEDTPSVVRDFAIVCEPSQPSVSIYCVCQGGELLQIIPANGTHHLVKRFPAPIGCIQICGGDDQPRLLLGGEIGACKIEVSGEVLWKYEPSGIVRGVAVLKSSEAREEMVVVADDAELLLFGPDGIKKRLHYNAPEVIYSLQAVSLTSEETELIFGTRYGDVEVLDQDFRLKWSYRIGNFVRSVYAADINEDGNLEVVAGDADKNVYVISASGRLLFGPIRVSDRIQTVYMGDVESDGRIEIVVGTRDRLVHVFDVQTQELRWRFVARDWPSGIVSMREENTGIPKLVISTGRGVTIYKVRPFRDLFRIANDMWETKSKNEQRSIFLNMSPRDRTTLSAIVDDWVLPEHRLSVVWGHKVNERVRALWPIALNQQDPSAILVGSEAGLIELGFADGSVAYEKAILPRAVRRIWPYDLANPDKRLIIGTGDGSLYSLYGDGTMKELFQTNRAIASVYSLDIDQDGEIEILIGTEDLNLYVLDSDGRMKLRHRTSMFVRAVFAWDVDADGQIEILAGTEDKYVDVLTWDGKLKWRFEAEGSDQRWIWVIVDGGYCRNGALRIIASSNNRTLYALNGKTGEVEWSYKAKERMHTLHSCKLIGSSDPAIVAASSEGIQMIDHSGKLIRKYDTGRVSAFWINDTIDLKNHDMILAVNGKYIYMVKFRATC